MSPPTFSCTWVKFYKRGGWSLTTRLSEPPDRLTAGSMLLPSYKLQFPHSSFGIFQIRNSHIEQTVVEKGSKRIYWTSKCFCHAIKHLGSCVKHTLTLRPRKFFSRVTNLAPQTSAHHSMAPNRQPVFIMRPEQNWWNGQRLKYVRHCCCSLTIASVVIFEPFFTETPVLENSSSCK